MAGTNMKFPDPHEVPTIPGTEGWERMYPLSLSIHHRQSGTNGLRKKHVLV